MLNNQSKLILNVTHKDGLLDKESVYRPKLEKWTFDHLTANELLIRLNMSNPLFVSIDEPDLLSIQVLDNNYFVALSDNRRLDSGFG